MKPNPKFVDGGDIEISEKNGFKKAKALPVTRLFMLTPDYIKTFGDKVSSLEKESQSVDNSYAIMFDDYDKKIGYPINEKSFSKYDVTKKSVGDKPGIAVKNDDTIFLAKRINKPFIAVIWNNEELPGKAGDYLVAVPKSEDYRVINGDSIFKKTFQFI